MGAARPIGSPPIAPNQIAWMEAGLSALRDVYVAARNAMIDDVVDPRETRPTVIRALEMAAGKRVQRPWKRHGVMPM